MSNEGKTESKKAKVISFINMKGGVGKTTLCREIGYTLNKEFKKSILFIDIDPQANLTQSLFEKYNLLPQDLFNDLKSDEQKEIKICNQSINVLLSGGQVTPEKDDLIAHLEENNPKLDLIPGDLKTVFLERNNTGSIAENSLDKFIAKKRVAEDYDFIFIDCPPTYSFYTTAAFNASDYYIVPVGIDPYSVLGIDLLEQVVFSIKDNNWRAFETKHLENMGIIFNPLGYTSNATISRQFSNQKDSIISSEKLKKYQFYYFRNIFTYNSKYKEELGYFNIDSNDNKHNNNINSIVLEFLDRLSFLNSQLEDTNDSKDR
ncbi:ParA family protein [Levilactobacillus brevis]|uniref:ParA family protein n=1 Tax=Levilactobacillus brevis TaxID=1580 RepID=UPI00111EF4FA|nr:ParA family protein [Levilactobacillus brevis]TOY85852.1 ParA family protein [Levilactobacillus brevis]